MKVTHLNNQDYRHHFQRHAKIPCRQTKKTVSTIICNLGVLLQVFALTYVV